MESFVSWCQEHEWIASKSLFLVTPGEGLDAKALELADTIQLDAGTMKYVLLLLAAYPLAAVFARLPNAAAKHLFSTFLGVWIMQFVFYGQWIHSFISSAATYLMVLTLPNRHMPHVVFAFVLGYICLSHIYRAYVDYMGWSLDFTGPQMVLTIKLSSFAYNVWDGRKWAEIEKDTGDKRKDRVLKARRDYAIRSMPNPLEFFGYIYCFSSILAGPAFEYKEYDNATSGKAYEKDGKPHPMPSNWAAALSKFGSGMLCLTLFQVGSGYFPLTGMRSSEVAGMPIPKRIMNAWITLFFVRMKYFFAWKTADGASVLGGFGFQGYGPDGQVVGWDGETLMEAKREASRGGGGVGAESEHHLQGLVDDFLQAMSNAAGCGLEGVSKLVAAGRRLFYGWLRCRHNKCGPTVYADSIHSFGFCGTMLVVPL
ncbi:acyltransferase [Ectocarpus siliculosus]|uniref:Acyltransferase n=1 Tax=Ectocarpus siliculosus TaxID=2880 RepID=D7FYX9_ECTSI|nr:acyltransferase [Ectocarpus siliculosus]|eukprot:CBJ26621.1 acyltransferase [Ectocarpus siliculosus]